MAPPGVVLEDRLASEVLSASERGYRLFPVKPRGKTPLVKGWQSVATSNRDQLEAWANGFPGCNWGMPVGRGSGVFVLDVDGDAGIASLDALKRSNGELLETLSVSTACGSHYYFVYPDGRDIRNSAGRLGLGLDIRGEGGYVVIPPSVHPSGARYRYANCAVAVAAPPQWLLQKMTPQWARVERIPGNKIGILIEGHRNDGLTRLAGGFRRRGADLAELETQLLQANLRRCRPPLNDTEVLRIAASMALYPVGGPDPLETAWAATDGQVYKGGYERFMALARELQNARPGLSFTLPMKRIGPLAGCDWTQVRRWCHRAMCEGLLRRVGAPIPKRRAAHYVLCECPTREPDVPLVSTTSGLGGHSAAS
jgi:hypothetical protein